MSAPVLPKSLAPNRWYGTSTKGATVHGNDTTRDQLTANTTGVTLVGGAMDDTYVAYDANTKIVEDAGDGIDTILTYGHAYTLGVNVENLRLMGSANATATGNAGNNILTGNSGSNVITTGGGNDVLVGSGGADTYVPTKETGSITWITSFKAAGTTIDKIDLQGFGLAGFDSIRARMTQLGTDVQIDLGNNQKVLLEGKTVSALTAANFIVEAATSNPPPTDPTPTDPPTTDPTPTDPTPTDPVLSLPDLPTSLGPNRWLSTSTKGATLTGSDGARDQLAANTTGVTLVGGAMDDTYVAYDANTKVIEEAGAGIDTVLTYGHAYTIGANVENLRLLGSANSTATGNTGNNILTGNSGSNVIATGGGSDVLVGSGGTDTYVPTKETGSITWITKFKATGTTIDKIDLRGFGLAGFDSIRSRMTQLGTNVQIDLGNNQKVALESTSVSELTAANFIVEAASTSPTPTDPPPTNPPTTDPTPTDPTPTDPVLSLPDLPTSLAPNRWLSTATKGATLTGSDGARDQLAANTTGVTLVGKAMDDTYVAYDANTKIVEGAGGGIDTVLTYGHAYTLGANVENLRLLGSANSTATGNAGNNILTGNSGSNVIATGGGSDVLVGSGGTDTYVPTKETGSVTWITSFKAAGTTIDKIDLRGFGLAGFDSIQARMTQLGTDVQIDLGNNQKIMLEGKTVSALTAANFIVETASSNPTPTDPPPTDPTPTDPTPVDPPPSNPPPTDTGLPANDLVMTFHDEFNTLNLYSTWKPTDGWGNRTLIGNKELELYVDPQYKGLGLNPFSVENGILTITAAKANPALVPQLGGYKYTSGMLSSHASFSQQYGYFEVRAQMTTEQGMWPAFWMLATHGKWPPELDVLEVVGKNPNAVVQSVHTGAGTNSGKTTWVSGDLANAFHTYGMDWTASTITFYFDGQKTYQVATPADMHTPMYMLLNLAVGGTWPGSPDGTTDWSKTDLKVDYVRAYKHDPNAVQTLTIDPVQIASLKAVISNATDPANLMDSFTAAITGANTSTTYNASQLDLAGQDPNASVTVAYDVNGGITVTNNGIWNAVKNATVKSSESGSVTIHNFVDAEIELGNGDNTVTVTDAKRGSVTTGSGNDHISVTGYNNSTNPDTMTINAGDGANTISYSGAANTKVGITTGSGSDTITVSGKAAGTIAAGGGADRIVINSTGAIDATGGAGQDVFEFIRGAHATISDFNAAEDSIVIRGGSSSTVQVKAGSGYTLVDLGNGASVTLAGVTAPASGIHVTYA